jgi:exonuclease VII small subunit
VNSLERSRSELTEARDRVHRAQAEAKELRTELTEAREKIRDLRPPRRPRKKEHEQ